MARRISHPIRRMLVMAALCAGALASSAFANMGSDDKAPDDPNLAAGRKAIDAQDWTAAIRALEKAVAANPDSADAHNWLGFAHRKRGNYQAAFDAYGRALTLDPRHKGAHEYIGEAYLATGQLAKAEAHVAELARLCSPIPCEELRQLKRAVAEYRKSNP
jgi:Flp pilus assembly protein TadD